MGRGSILAAAVAALPSVARACPVCFAARDEAERLALLGTTVLLTSLPVIMIGAIIYWIARRSREVDAEPSSTREADDDARSSSENQAIPLRRASSERNEVLGS